MKNPLKTLYKAVVGAAIVFVLGMSMLAFTPAKAAQKFSLHKSMHWIVLVNDAQRKALQAKNLDPFEKAGCTANAIAEHVLLTAQHCDLPNAVIYLDGSRVAHQIDKKVYDGADHMLIVISDVKFSDTLHYDPSDYAAPVQGEYVMFWGNPRGIRDQYREGFCAGSTVIPGDDLTPGYPVFIFAMPGAPGDSGSAILSKTDGRLVAVLTYGIEGGKFAGGYALRFTKGQMAEAGL